MVLKSIHLNLKYLTLKIYNGRRIFIVLEYDTRPFIVCMQTPIIIDNRIYTDHSKYFSYELC